MKIEINDENKAKFFALHWGQEVAENPLGVLIVNGKCLDYVSEGVMECILNLKPLSAISDEDAWGVGIRVNCWAKWERKQDSFIRKDDDFHKVHIAGGRSFAECIGKEFGYGLSHPFANNSTDILDAYDFLRSRGYALPWMGLSVDEMILAGWIRLETDTISIHKTNT